MKKSVKSIVSVILGASMSISAFAFTACGDEHTAHVWGAYEKDGASGCYQVCTVCGEHSETKAHEYSSTNDIDCNNCGFVRTLGGLVNDPDAEDPTKATISVTADKNEINAGTNETVKATATIEGLKDKSVVWSLDGTGKSYVNISQDGVLSLKETLTPQTDQIVKIVATSTVSAVVTGSVSVTVKAQVLTGEVDGLTTEMFTALGKPQITVTGEVEDVYDDFNNNANDVSNKYDYKVMMSDGAWYGEWNRKGSKDVETFNYRRAQDGVTFNEVYIDKDNKVAQKPVKDYMSVEAEWDEQHLWNHLSQLGVNVAKQWQKNSSTGKYVYKFDNNSAEDVYLRTYLAVSLTPMLVGDDTLEQITLTVEDGAITKLEARTYVIYEGGELEGSSEGATSMSYTNLTAVFSGVGSTTVPDPTPYVADEDTELLATALENMGSATNYTFRAVEKTISAPDYSDGDYSLESVSAAGAAKKARVANSTTATGTVGLVGKITADAVLLAKTSAYSASMDGNNYRTEYSGYKKIDDTTYDYFAYSATEKTLVGQRQYKGSLSDILPKFDFSANVFEFDGSTREIINGEKTLVSNYVLRESAITRDIAMQISAHSNATSAQGSTNGRLTIKVIGEGADARIYSTEFPYDLTSGTYTGTVETIYSKVGTTELDADTFDGYQARVLKDSWSQYDVMYYHANHSTIGAYDEIDAGTLFTNIFGADAVLPSPLAFYGAFGDAMSGPVFDWNEVDNTATGGTKEYTDYLTLTFKVDEVDENGKISKDTYDGVINALTEELEKCGYKISGGYLLPFGSSPYSRVTYYNEEYGIVIQIENNRTKTFWVYFKPVSML